MSSVTQAPVSRLESEFDNFLYAPIGVERSGMPLSVLSLLARRNVDPWQEAAQLDGLPEKTAIQRLASFIPDLQDGPSMHLDSETNATRLIALLPRRASSLSILSRKNVPASDAANIFSAALLYAICVTFLLFTLNAQWIAAKHQSPVQTDNAHGANIQPALPADRTMPRNGGLVNSPVK